MFQRALESEGGAVGISVLSFEGVRDRGGLLPLPGTAADIHSAKNHILQHIRSKRGFHRMIRRMLA